MRDEISSAQFHCYICTLYSFHAERTDHFRVFCHLNGNIMMTKFLSPEVVKIIQHFSRARFLSAFPQNTLFWVSSICYELSPESKVHGANMGPTLGLSAPEGPTLYPWTLLSGSLRVHNICSVIIILCLFQADWWISKWIISWFKCKYKNIFPQDFD